MRSFRCLLIVIALSLICSSVQAQTENYPRLLRNNDVLLMVQDNVEPEVIVTKILSSPCNFDVFPPVLRDLRRRGVPEEVLRAMLAAPNGPPSLADVDPNVTPAARIQIPEGTIVEVETLKETSSAKAKEGDAITFLAKRRVFVNNVLVVERGAIARARVIKVRNAKPLGRAGMLAWEMEYIVGVDGTHIPISLKGKQKGANRTAALAGGAVATGALIFPYSSPVALIWGLKKGDEALLRGSKVFAASVQTKTEIAGIQPRPGGVIYRDRDTVKASAAPPTKTKFEQGFRKRSNRQR